MTTLSNRPNTALLVIDVQNGVVGGAHDRDNVVANVRTLVDRARAAGVEVVWIQHNSDELQPNTESWQYVPELVRLDSEPLGELRTATHSRTPTWRKCWRPGASANYLSPAPKRTSASVRRSTARSFAATTRRSSATPTRRKTAGRTRRSTSRNGNCPHEPLLEVPPDSGRTAGTVETTAVDFAATADTLTEA